MAELKPTLNPDSEFVRLFHISLEANEGYCPCAIEKTDDTKCMCKEFRDALKAGKEGPCHCGLWIAKPRE